MSDFEFPSEKEFSRLTLARAERMNARFREVAASSATKLDKTGGSITGPLSVSGDFSTSGSLTVGGAASLGGILDMNGFRVTEAGNATQPQDLVTLAQLTSTAFSSALPSQAGNAGKFVTTDGTNASWASITPAGQRTFTATGTLPNGATVVLNADGTVSTVTSNNDTTGTATVFRSAATTYIASAALSATQVVVCYYDGTNSQAIIGNISGNSVTFPGAAVTINSGSTSHISVCALPSTSSFVVAYYDAATTNFGRARVCSVSGTTISPGTSVGFNGGGTAFISIAPLSSTAVVIAYQDTGNSSYGTAIIGTISGTSISFQGSEYVFLSNTAVAVSVAALSPSSFVVSFGFATPSTGGGAIGGVASGNNISFGSAVSFDGAAASVTYTSIVALTSTSFLVAWARGTTDGRAKIGTVSGTTVSFTGASDVVFNAAATYDLRSAKISSTSVVVAYQDGGNSSYGTICLGTITGSSISFGSEIVFRSATTAWIGCTAVGSSVFVGYNDYGNSNYGTGVVFQPASTNVANWIGITAQSIANGASGNVTILGGVNASVSGLTTGATYYLNNDGSLTTTQTSYKAGRALSATSLLITGAAQ